MKACRNCFCPPQETDLLLSDYSESFQNPQIFRDMGPKPKGKVVEEPVIPSEPEKPLVTLDNFQDYGHIFEALFNEVPFETARDSSKKERADNNFTSPSLVYGEITYSGFAEVFLKMRNYGLRPVGGKYVDIGSGSGKSIFAAAIVHKFEDCLGIEILQNLYTISVERLSVWNSMISEQEDLKYLQSTRIQFTHGDATVIDWLDADVVFMNSTCFEPTLFRQLEARANELKPGTFVITTTQHITSSHFELLDTLKMLEGWGECTTFIHRRRGIEVEEPLEQT